MRPSVRCLVALGEVLLMMTAAQSGDARPPARQEMADAGGWTAAHLRGRPEAAPFAFAYGGRPWAELAPAWPFTRRTRRLDERCTRHTLRWADPASGLVVRLAAVEYRDFPTVEWTLHLKNTGSDDTPVLSEIEPLHARLATDIGGDFVLHHHTGSPCTATDYQPFETPLREGAGKRIATSGGRSSNSALPYFNLEWPGGGAILAVGWPGQWAAEFARDGQGGVQVRAGQEGTHFRLHPGEEVRTPLIVVQFYRGDRVGAQNVWRQWMLAHNLPRPGGRLPGPQWAGCSSHQYHEMIQADEENQKMFVDRYLEEGVRLDYWWMDAGWYVNSGDWPNTGTWEVDAKRFPHGLRAITDHAHAKGVKSIVWFEPERVAPGTWLYENHPEWLLGRDGGDKLLDLGNPRARHWLTGHVDRLIREQGIDLYRNDFNIDPLEFWRANDAPDRQGITEIRYVTGLLAYWDALRRRHPDMLIDTCASGGRRNDLEILRRAVPLLRSDHILEPVSQQNHTYGIAFWIPFYGTGVNSTETYVFRSQMCPAVTACYDVRDRQLDYPALRRLAGEWRAVAECYLGDYYPLTRYDTGDDAWMAWQFDRPDLGRGMVQAFRRAGSGLERTRFRLRGLEPEARYAVKDLDAGDLAEVSGRDLMEEGLLVAVPAQPGAAIVTYQQVRPGGG